MANYLRLRLMADLSENSDYSDPEWQANWSAYEIQPDEVALTMKVKVLTTGTTIDTAELDLTDGAAAAMAIKNTDSTNYVQVAWTDISTTACVARIPAGGILVIPMMDPSPAPVLTANTASVHCKVVLAQV